ncbi:TPA: hypothetical protein OL520_002348 [Clostridioides difficile]|nr:hypothetical protein [Clostridioides difficile]
MYNNCMQKQDIIQIDYTTYGDNYQFKLPLNIDYMISKDALFIDGTKIESSANRYTFVWKKS